MANPLVADISRYEVVTDFGAAFKAGLRGIIHKATQGDSYVDPRYAERMQPALDAGLLYGSYHFADASPVAKQVDHFLSTVRPDLNPHLLLALDLEQNSSRHGGTMSLDSAKEWCRLVYRQSGQWPALYSGNLLKEYLGGHPDLDLVHLRLWLAHYAATPILPPGWTSCWLHQYTGDGSGPPPHTIPGITVDGANQGLDLNIFHGTDLGKEWTGVTPQVVAPVHAAPPGPEAFQTPEPITVTKLKIVPGNTTTVAGPGPAVSAGLRMDPQQLPGLWQPPKDEALSGGAGLLSATKAEVIAASSRLRNNERIANFMTYCFGGGGLSFAMFQQVRDFLIDWRSLAVLVVGGTLFGLIKWNSYKSHQEVQQGRYTPSGMVSDQNGNSNGTSP